MLNKNEKLKKQKLETLENEARELREQAYELISEYVEVEELELDDIKEELARIKKRYIESWSEASELM